MTIENAIRANGFLIRGRAAAIVLFILAVWIGTVGKFAAVLALIFIACGFLAAATFFVSTDY